MTELTYVFQTSFEIEARRVLNWLANSTGNRWEYLYSHKGGGRYEILTADAIAEDEAERINLTAAAIAHADIVAPPLISFRTYIAKVRCSVCKRMKPESAVVRAVILPRGGKEKPIVCSDCMVEDSE